MVNNHLITSHGMILQVPPRKLTWNLKMMVSNRNLLFQGFIFRFHVSFPGCTGKGGSFPNPKKTQPLQDAHGRTGVSRRPGVVGDHRFFSDLGQWLLEACYPNP